MKPYFLFDLDGTLADTGEGIMKSVAYALEALHVPPQPEEVLRKFVGPPLHLSFEQFCGLSPNEAMLAVEKYRERYREKGVLESQLYPGIKELLEALSQKAVLCVSTSKPLLFARQILELRGIVPLFSEITGANLDGTMTDKAEVIGETLRRLSFPPKEIVIMVGDRRQDVLGAKACGIKCIGVRYGFAEPGELEEAGADYIADSVAELRSLCEQVMSNNE